MSLLSITHEGSPLMPAPHPGASEQFFKIALEYYVSGRAACIAGCLFTTGSLLHHAVEMMLKGQLSKTISLQVLADRQQYGHSLPKCWATFKRTFATEDLTESDPMIAELDKFEQIRYPDNLLAHGASIGFGFCRGRVIQSMSTAHSVPEYQMGIGDVDAFFSRAMRLCHMNPQAYFGFLNKEGRRFVLHSNEEAKGWLL
jgi:hypothetical protein